MKIRNGFVSNSSSSSFLINGYDLTEQYDEDSSIAEDFYFLLKEFNEKNGTKFDYALTDYLFIVGDTIYNGEGYSQVDILNQPNVDKELDKLKEFLQEKGFKVADKNYYVGEMTEW